MLLVVCLLVELPLKSSPFRDFLLNLVSQVDDLGRFLMMTQSYGACMLISLAAREGSVGIHLGPSLF